MEPFDTWDKEPVSDDAAREAASALIDEHFLQPITRTQFRIPADRNDTDLLLMRYIKQTAALRTRLKEVEKERDEMQVTFDLQQSRIRVAQAAWQKRHGKPNVWPDLGELIDWMWGECKIASEAREEAEDEAESLQSRVTPLEEALVKGLLVLESLHAAVDWELSDELKASIAEAVYAGRAALTPAAPKEQP